VTFTLCAPAEYQREAHPSSGPPGQWLSDDTYGGLCMAMSQRPVAHGVRWRFGDARIRLDERAFRHGLHGSRVAGADVLARNERRH